MKHLSLHILLIILLTVSCSEERFRPEGDSGREGEIRLSLVVSEEVQKGDTRAISETVDEGIDLDYSISDFWLLQYNQGALVGDPVYVQTASSSPYLRVKVPEQSGMVYQCIVIANTHDRKLFTRSNVPTLDDLKLMGKKINMESELYQENPGAGFDLLMNGKFDLKYNETAPVCHLYRSVAKVTLILTNRAQSDMNVQSAQLCQLRNRIYYADQLLPGTDFPISNGDAMLNLGVDKKRVKPGESRTLVYYVPRNCLGTTQSTSEKDKNIDAPAQATYIELLAASLSEDRMYQYRFYLGENMVNDFNVIPNHNYILPVTFSGSGADAGDSRVVDLGPVSVKMPEANCYMLNPSDEMTMQVPVNQINKAFAGSLTPATEWVAEVIWQDIPEQVVLFTDKSGRPSPDGGITFNGTGETSFYVEHIPGTQTAVGNVLIGLRLKNENGVNGKDRKYLWSWHLWITPYNPDAVKAGTPWVSGKYSYPVQDGYVFRYDDNTFPNSLIGGNSEKGNPWGTSVYQDRYIMDRNLGALRGGIPDMPADGYKRDGLYYQYGRKDPFPRSLVNAANSNYGTVQGVQLFKIDGVSPPDFTAAAGDCVPVIDGGATIQEAVQHPYNFYTGKGVKSGDWASQNDYVTYPWNGTAASGKSIFDPCPPGWRLPDPGTFDVFTYVETRIDFIITTYKSHPNAESETYVQGDGAGYNFYMNASLSGGVTWYPASGYRNADNTGQIFNYGDQTWMWVPSAHPKPGRNESPIPVFYFNSADVPYTETMMKRSHGLPVRCIQE